MAAARCSRHVGAAAQRSCRATPRCRVWHHPPAARPAPPVGEQRLPNAEFRCCWECTAGLRTPLHACTHRSYPLTLLQDMAGDVVVGVGESLPAGRPGSGSGVTNWQCNGANPALQPAALPSGQPSGGALAVAGPHALLQRCSPANQRAAAQQSVVGSGAPPAAATVAATAPARLPAEQRRPGLPVVPPPALAPQPSDPDTQPLAAGLHTLPSFGSWRASSSQGRSLSGSGRHVHRRSRSLGSGLESGGREVGGSGGGRGSGGWAETLQALPGPVPRHTSDITFMPLGHQGGKWAADPAPAPAPAGAACCAATVAAVPILTRSTVAALLGQRQQPGGAGHAPVGRAVGRSLASEVTGESAGGASPAAAAPPLPAYRPWTAVRRVIDEVGRPAAQAGYASGSGPSRQQGQRGAARAVAPPHSRASADSVGTVAMPWDRPSQRRLGTSSVMPPASQRSLGRPPRPPGGRAADAVPRAVKPAVQARPPFPPLPPPVRWLTQDVRMHPHTPLMSTALPDTAPVPMLFLTAGIRGPGLERQPCRGLCAAVPQRAVAEPAAAATAGSGGRSAGRSRLPRHGGCSCWQEGAPCLRCSC